MDILLNAETEKKFSAFIEDPSHALLITGVGGLGKTLAAERLSESLLGLQPDSFGSYPYARLVQPKDGRVISIDAIRELEHFTTLRIPRSDEYQHGINRVVIIKDAHTLTEEAQNALLKTLEEPPKDTLLILTATSKQMLLPTICSRTQLIDIKRPNEELTKQYFTDRGFGKKAVDQAAMMTGSLPGMMTAILNNQGHPLLKAANKARSILQKPTFDRLAMVDSLAKNKSECHDILFILQQMARLALRQNNLATAKRWQQVQKSSYEASDQLATNANAKLTLTNLMLELH